MIDVTGINSLWTAFVAGLVTSLHCAGMCGPVACMLAPKPGSDDHFQLTASVYQTARIVSYTVIGTAAGGLGLLGLRWVEIYNHSLARFLPWALVLFFALVALRVDKWLPKPAFAGKWFYRAAARINKLPRPVAGGLLGFFTPLLPCGPLYMVFGLALMTQSPVRGAEFLLVFALGTLPLLWLVQTQYVSWRSRLSPVVISRIQRGVALAAAVVIGLRLYYFETGAQGLFCGS